MESKTQSLLQIHSARLLTLVHRLRQTGSVVLCPLSAQQVFVFYLPVLCSYYIILQTDPAGTVTVTPLATTIGPALVAFDPVVIE